MKTSTKIVGCSLFILLSSCGAYFNQPVTVQKASYGEGTPATLSLKSLPPSNE